VPPPDDSHEGGRALLHVLPLGAGVRLVTQTHDEAALVHKVAGDVHGEQQQQEDAHQDAGDDARGQVQQGVVAHVCRASRRQDKTRGEVSGVMGAVMGAVSWLARVNVTSLFGLYSILTFLALSSEVE